MAGTNTCYNLDNGFPDKQILESWLRVTNPSGWYDNTVQLAKASNGIYFMESIGYFKPILGSLVRSDLAECLNNWVPNQIELKPVIIKRKNHEEQWGDYFELLLKMKKDNNDYESLIFNDLQILTIDGSFYVSPKLKNLLVNTFRNDELSFSQGPILYAGKI